MPDLQAALSYANQHQERFLEEFKDFCAIPSISTLSENAGDVARTAQWLADELARLGLERIQIIPTKLHPVVCGEWMGAPGKPVVLVYGHYDVQPVDPIEEWISPPFDPVVRGDNLYARGASDMKGQIQALLKALEALKQQGAFPVNIRFMLEGEEEMGSPSLEDFVEKHRGLLVCDVVLNCDGGIAGPDTPALTYGLRGLSYFELEVFGPSSDLHSGVFGGAVHNPAQALCELIAGMHGPDGSVNLPGFYDTVRPIEPEERAALAGLPLSDEEWKTLSGVPAPWGEAEYTITERIGARPTLEVNGLVSGFTGEGAKTVLPARAMAKLSMRLVPDQDPFEVEKQLRAYLETHAPNTIRWELRQLSGAGPGMIERDSPYMRAARQALEEVFGIPPKFKREGGSIPVVSLLKERIGADTVLMGFELPDAGFHGPNEKMHLPSFYRLIETYIRFLCIL